MLKPAGPWMDPYFHLSIHCILIVFYCGGRGDRTAAKFQLERSGPSGHFQSHVQGLSKVIYDSESIAISAIDQCQLWVPSLTTSGLCYTFNLSKYSWLNTHFLTDNFRWYYQGIFGWQMITWCNRTVSSFILLWWYTPLCYHWKCCATDHALLCIIIHFSAILPSLYCCMHYHHTSIHQHLCLSSPSASDHQH